MFISPPGLPEERMTTPASGQSDSPTAKMFRRYSTNVFPEEEKSKEKFRRKMAGTSRKKQRRKKGRM